MTYFILVCKATNIIATDNFNLQHFELSTFKTVSTTRITI